MIIKTKLTQKDFTQVNFYLFYRKWFIRVLTVMSILILLLTLSQLIFNFDLEKNPSSGLTFPIIVLVGLPLITYYTSKKNYKTASRIHETIEYDFTPEYLDIKGESFTSQMAWNKFYKVVKSKHWLLIYQNSQSANIIPLRDIWESQIDELKAILTKNGVKNNL